MTVNMKNIEDVKTFWESNPLFTGESKFTPGTLPFFEEHKDVYVTDCFAGKMDTRIFPFSSNNQRVLDLGCGPGFWVIELSRNGAQNVTAADLTSNALSLTKKRCKAYNVEANLSLQNAESLTFENFSFSHVNCQGVIHHTPNTQACVKEIARVLEEHGTACISVYYKNVFLRTWPLLKYVAKIISWLGAGLKGRGREKIYSASSADEIVRLYDGSENPIGKAYSEKEFLQLLEPFFHVEETYLHFFPARSLPFPVPKWLHKILDKYCGFMIYAQCKKK